MTDFSIQPAGHGPVHAVRNVPTLTHPTSSGIGRLEAFEDSAPRHDVGDRVEISDMARLLAKMRDMPSVRQDRIDQVRSAIDRGLYDTPDRLDLALDQMIEEEDLLGQ
jgi:hypothetical protein